MLDSQTAADPDDVVIRASSLTGYPDCMRRTAARLFAPEIRAMGYRLRSLPNGIGAATGTACHAAAAFTLRAKLETGGLGRPADASAMAIAALDEEVAGGVQYDDCSPNLNTAQQQVLRQTAVYRTQVASKIVPLMVETRLEAKIGSATVTGQVDAYVADGLRDLKTGRHRRINGFQYGLYSLLHEAHRHPVQSIVEDFVPRAPLRKPQPPAEQHAYDVAESERAAMAIVRRMTADLRSFRLTADPWSFIANPLSMLCSDKYCPAWGTDFCTVHKDARK